MNRPALNIPNVQITFKIQERINLFPYNRSFFKQFKYISKCMKNKEKLCKKIIGKLYVVHIFAQF